MKKIFTLCVVLCLSYLTMGASTPKHEFRATWLATVSGIDWPKTKATNDATREQQKQELIDILDKMKAGNLNAVCFQVRSLCDAMYQSSYEPWSIALTGTRGEDPGYDPLQFAIDEAHKRGMELHVWVNPFRASTSTLAATDMLWNNAGDWLIKYNNSSFSGYLIDPGYPESRAYVVKVLMEIINKYDVDGLVMDDYFYAYGGTTNQDRVAQALHYRASEVIDVNNNGNKIDDWRRSNVDNVIKAMYDSIQVVKPWVRFGMGPGGIWSMDKNAAEAYGLTLPSGIRGSDPYTELYCNTVEWIKQGWVDYVNPQIYWSTQVTAQDYDVLCQWWSKDVCEHFSNLLPNGKKVHHFPSPAAYKVYGDYSGYEDGVEEMKREMDANRANLSSGYTGAVFYNTTSYLKMYADLAASHFKHTALTPPMDWKSNTALAAPTNLTVSGSTLSWEHATAERFTVYVYPKGTAWSTAKNDPAYLQGVIYGKSMDISGIDTNANDIAVCAYDRYGVEHEGTIYSDESGTVTPPASGTITYELNGGMMNEFGWTSKNDMFQACMADCSVTDLATLDEVKASADPFYAICSKLTDVSGMLNSDKWDWLEQYIMDVQNTQAGTLVGAGSVPVLTAGVTSAAWRYALAAFFIEGQRTAWPYTADFSQAGKDEAYIPAWKHAYANPTEPTDEFALNAPYREGYTFLGWYTNADFSDEKVTTINAETTGTLYAKWINSDWIITYTSTNGNIVTPNKTDAFGANIVSNTYENGQGIITFDGPVTSIGSAAFFSCESLTSITIPNSVTTIGRQVFSVCNTLETIWVESGNTTYDSRENCNAIIETETNTLIVGCQNTIIPNSVTSIGDDAFDQCFSLASLTIPNSVISIGSSAFSGCSSLTSMTIPNYVTSIGGHAFAGCTSLTSITIPNSVISIGECAFWGCSNLTSMVVESGNTEYDSRENCNAIIRTATNTLIAGCQNTIIPNSVTSIGKEAFGNCSNLNSITIPNSVESIGEHAFEYCSSLTSITIPTSVESIGERAFAVCDALTSMVVESGNTAYDSRENCNAIIETATNTLIAGCQNTIIPNSVTSIGRGAFYCFSLTAMTIPNSVTSIGYYAFYGCRSLTSITIPNSVISIGSSAFSHCSSLTSMTIPNSVMSIGNHAFDKCSSLYTIYVESATPPELGEFALARPLCVIPCGSLAAYKSSAWSEQVGNFMENCKEGLQIIYTPINDSLVIPHNVDAFGANIVSNTYVDGVGRLYFDGIVTSIGDSAFYNSETLSSITIPETVTLLGYGSFDDCTSLTKIRVKATTPPKMLGGYTFHNTPLDTCLIPCGTLDAYQSSDWASQVGEFVEVCPAVVKAKVPASWEDDVITVWVWTDGAGTEYPTTKEGDWYVYTHTDNTEFNIIFKSGKGWKGNTYQTVDINGITANTCLEIQPTNTKATYTIVDCPSIIYELNGGVTNDYDWMSKDDMYHELLVDINAIMPTTKVDVDTVTLAYDKTKNIQEGIPTYWDDLSSLLIHSDFLSKWGWLINYMDSACASESKYLPSTLSVYLRYNLSAFFFEKEYTSWPQTPDYSKYGLYPYYQPAWQHAYDNPTNPTEEFILNAPYREGYTFAGWYTNADLSGEKITIVEAETNDTLYAKWIENSLVESTWKVLYTSTNGGIVAPNAIDVFGANIVSNVYENGVGTITFDGPVTSIGDWAFERCPSLTSITIPESVTSIGYAAFCDCTSLTYITIPNSVTSIGYYAFAYCSSLISITIPKSVTSIGDYAFEYCSSLTSMTVENGNTVYDSRENCNAIIETATNTLIAGCQNTIIPNSVTSIGNNAFYGCSSLTSLTIPNSVTSIGDWAFAECTSLASITLPNSVTSIGDEAFCLCSSLTSITIPNSVTSIGDWAFWYCYSLDTIHVEATTPPALEDSTVFKDTPSPVCVIPCGTLAAYEASDWASQVGSFVEDCVEGQQIYYTSTNDSIVTPYNVNAFDANIVSNIYENGVGTITFEAPITIVGDSAFHECSTLTSITIPNGVTKIKWAFEKCTSLESVELPDGITTIGDIAFHNCSSLRSIDIPNSVTYIGGWAFGASAIESLIIPTSVTHIGVAAFTDCNSLRSIVVEDSNPKYDSRNNCNAIIETATNTLIASSLNTIIPNTVTTIATRAFQKNAITSIDIPNSVVHIEAYAFRWATQLNSITIPNSVNYIGDSVFYSCPLDTIRMEAMTPPTIGVNPFSSSPVCVIPCGSFAAYNTFVWASQVGEFVEEGCAPIQMCGDDLYWEYADGVLTITGTGDMYDYADDKTGPAPWYDVRGSITTINMPNEMTKIGDYAFYKCTEVTSINMPTTLTTIGEKAFAQDTKLACEIILPASMTTIATRAFFNCKAVPAFHVEATTPPTVQADAFDYTTAPIHVPCGYGHVYGKHTQWGVLNLEMCELLQDNVYYYPIDGHTARAVTYHSNPTDTIVIPSAVVIDGMPRTVTEVADFAFADCKDIPAIIFNEGLEYIGERAFVRCYGLQGTIVLPATLETIGERAFSYCDNVEKFLIQAMTPPALGDGAFTCANHDALFYVSCEVMDDYKVAARWSSLKSRLRDACLNIYHYNTPLGTNGVYTTEDTLVASIYYRRQFTPYRWETLYLPFEVDRVTVLEDGVEYDLTAWDIVYGGHYFIAKPDGWLNMEIIFGFTDELDAHTPYIIQFKDDYYRDKIITFYGKESWNKLSTSFEVLSSSSWMQIAGNTTLQDQLLEKPVYMLRSGLDFILQKTTTTLHPFECYVMPYATPSGTPARMNVRFRGDVPTAVESVKGNESHLTYSVDGYTLTVYPQGQAFSIYSLNGALIYSCEAGKEAVDCELNSGCYLLHAGAEAHKIML